MESLPGEVVGQAVTVLAEGLVGYVVALLAEGVAAQAVVLLVEQLMGWVDGVVMERLSGVVARQVVAVLKTLLAIALLVCWLQLLRPLLLEGRRLAVRLMVVGLLVLALQGQHGLMVIVRPVVGLACVLLVVGLANVLLVVGLVVVLLIVWLVIVGLDVVGQQELLQVGVQVEPERKPAARCMSPE